MRKVLANSLIVIVLSLPVIGVHTEPLGVDRIIDRHIEARGGYASIKALRNLVYSGGAYEEGDYRGEGNATMSLGRPYFKLVGNKNEPGDFMEGYDGAAWEWFADPGIVVRTVGAASAAIRHYAGVEGPLVDYQEKGSTGRLKGEVAVDGRPVFVVELTRRDGFVEQFYIDKESYVIVASGHAAPIHAFGESITTVTKISDYRPVAGVMIPFRFVTVEMPSGKKMGSMQWGKIEANLELPAGWFSPPVFARTPLQGFIENLYGQRSDIRSVMWTYHEFRHAYPGIDTTEALNVASYQMLKMGAVDSAITILEKNSEDNPVSANTRFGLGRAYKTVGRVSEARKQFVKALELDPAHKRAMAALASLGE